jgi:hypothetical protein
MLRMVRRRTLVRNGILGSMGIAAIVAAAGMLKRTTGPADGSSGNGNPPGDPSTTPGALLWRQSTPIQAADPAGMTLALGAASLYVIGNGVSSVDPVTGAQTWHIGSSVLGGATAGQISAQVSPLVSGPGALCLMIPGALLELAYSDGARAYRYDLAAKGPSRLVGFAGGLFVCDTGHAPRGSGGPPSVVGVEWDKTTPVWTKSPDPDQRTMPWRSAPPRTSRCSTSRRGP